MKERNSALWRNERGSTLILVILLSLVLSASAIVAMRDVARSARAAGVFRTRTQAQLTSDAADRLFADWVGNKAASLVDGMKNSLAGTTSGGVANIVGAQGSNGAPTQADREKLMIEGGQIEFSHLDLQSDCGGTCVPLLTPYVGSTETGLYQIAAGETTFETRRQTKFRVKIRDLTDGFPAPGYSEGLCFKKAIIVAEALVGTVDPNWNKSNNVAQSRHMIDAVIGPVECGY